jgi:hypothetical protein
LIIDKERRNQIRKVKRQRAKGKIRREKDFCGVKSG